MSKNPDQGWRDHVLNSLPRMEMPEPAAGFQPGPANPLPLNFGGPVRPDFDPVEFLPPAAADKLRLLRQRAADAHRIMPAFEEIRQASMARITAEQALTRLTNHPQQGGFGLKAEDRQVIAATKTVEKATADFKRLQELQEVRTAAWQTASAALAGCENWLKNGRPGGTALEQFDGPEPKLNKGETVLDGIDRLRRRVRELRADQHRIQSAPFPSNYAKAQMRTQIEALAQQGVPSVSLLTELDREIVWPTRLMQSTVYNAQQGAVTSAEFPDTVAMFAWLHKDALIAALDREITTESDDKAALTHEARQKAEAEVMGDLLDIERQESALVWHAQAQSLPVEHRADCSPLAILQIRLVTAPRAGNEPTSPEHGIDIAQPGLRR